MSSYQIEPIGRTSTTVSEMKAIYPQGMKRFKSAISNLTFRKIILYSRKVRH